MKNKLKIWLLETLFKNDKIVMNVDVVVDKTIYIDYGEFAYMSNSSFTANPLATKEENKTE